MKKTFRNRFYFETNLSFISSFSCDVFDNFAIGLFLVVESLPIQSISISFTIFSVLSLCGSIWHHLTLKFPLNSKRHKKLDICVMLHKGSVLSLPLTHSNDVISSIRSSDDSFKVMVTIDRVCTIFQRTICMW